MRMTIHGDYTPGSAVAPEVWAVNIRQALVFGSVDDVGVFPSNWDVASDFSTATETDWDLETTWGADGPLTTSFDVKSYLNDYVGTTVSNWVGVAGFSSHVRVLGVNLYPCDTTGKAIDGNYARLTYHTPPLGSSSSKMLPPENSIVASWETHKIGKRGRGRIYPPPVTVDALTSYGVVDSSFAGDYMDQGKALIEGLSYSATAGTGPHVRSVVTGPSSSGGWAPYTHYATILGIRVGLVVDTQRRRRNKLPEGYLEEAVTQV